MTIFAIHKSVDLWAFFWQICINLHIFDQGAFMNRLAYALGLVLAGFFSAAHGATIYSNDFESASTADLTGGAITTAPNGENFYGVLSAGSSAALTLTGLSGYTNIDLAFDLYTLNSLDGDGTICCGPDYFKLTAGSTTLLNETFSNFTTQSYGGAGSAAGTGSDSALTGVLGYFFFGPDHTYHLGFTGIASSVAALTITFFGNSNQSWEDEGFGIDNLKVTGTRGMAPVPLPAGLLLLAAALVGLCALRRRKGV